MPSRVNRKLLRRIADYIEQNPRELNQEVFTSGKLWLTPKNETVCKTPCCIGGLALILSDVQVEDTMYIPKVAQKLLQITRESRHLLFGKEWPGYWFNRANLIHETQNWRNDSRDYSPATYEAVIILRKMAGDGYIWPLLSMGRQRNFEDML